LRLPARLPQDAPVLCQAILQQARKANPDLAILSNPLFAGDYAALISLLPDFSPRIAKRILNDSLFDAQKSGLLAYPEDCGALIRLHAVYTAFPKLQRHAKSLIEILECKDNRKQSDWIESLVNRSDVDGKQLKRLVQSSHSVQPLGGNWKRLIAIHGHDNPTTESKNSATLTELLSNQRMSQTLWESLYAISQGYGDSELNFWLEKNTFSKLNLAIGLWPTLGVILVHTPSNAHRLRLVRYYQKLLADTEQKHPANESVRLLHYALFRYWLGDHPVMALLSEDQHADFIAQISGLHEKRRIYLLPIVDPKAISIPKVFDLLQSSQIEEYRVIRDWLGEVPFSEHPDDSTASLSAENAFLAAIWPPICDDNNDPQGLIHLSAHLALFRQMYDRSSLRIAPHGIVSALFTEDTWRRLAAEKKGENLLRCLRGVLCDGDRWSLDAWRLLIGQQPQGYMQNLVLVLIENTPCHQSRFWAVALLIACDVKSEKSIDLLLEQVISLGTANLAENLICIESNPIWRLAEANQLTKLLQPLISPSSGDWKQLKNDYSSRLANLFKANEQEALLIKTFNLDFDW